MLSCSHVRHRITDLGDQLRLKLEHATRLDRERFILSASNEEAASRLDAWPSDDGGALALIGPAGAGKTHLANTWAERVGAALVSTDVLADERVGTVQGQVLFDAADVAPHGEAFFHLLNRAERGDCSLLLTGRVPPAAWAAEVADLRSRLNAIRVVELHEPDDALLRGVLLKLFRERNIRPSPELLAYLVSRIERSVPAAVTVVAALDDAAHAEGKAVSRALARVVLKDEVADALDDV